MKIKQNSIDDLAEEIENLIKKRLKCTIVGRTTLELSYMEDVTMMSNGDLKSEMVESLPVCVEINTSIML